MADAAAGGGSALGRRLCFIPEKFQLHLAMLALQFGYAGFHVVSRAALNMGISKIVFPVYRNILAFLLLLPFAYFLEKKERPPISWNFVIQFFLLAIVGIEKVRLDRKDGISKVAGTLLCVAGASVITLYNGPVIYSPTPRVQSVRAASPMLLALGDAKGKNWTLGCIFLIGHCLSWSGWLVLQAPILKKYPARLSFTSYQCFFGVIQFLVIAAFLERDPQAWLVHSGGELFSVFYADHRCGADHNWIVLRPMGKKRGEKFAQKAAIQSPQSRSAADQPPTSSRPSLSHSSPSQRRMFDQQNSNFNYSYLAVEGKKKKKKKKS
ncbi:UNVERIFIED_CONTAM: protein WALLS ARE THIN 1 [Sesamum radiatum]|uniref:Protein WALLS ARE THIN 1 n=1 Tax=Sesamum radiatum TaxID=300843 RepID=A0AAW2M4A4_SESRA